MPRTFCPLILVTRNISIQDFGSAIVNSACNQGQWEVVFQGQGNVLFQCAWWDSQHGCCAIQHVSHLAMQEERPQRFTK